LKKHIVIVAVCLALIPLEYCFAGIDYDVRLLVYGLLQEPADNLNNPENTVFQIAKHKAVFELRPDFSLIYKKIDLSVKPRLRYQWKRMETAGSSESKETGELFVNEWLTRFMASDRLFLSYGRENLQWGPGWLSSPSNPFFYYNGRLNPMLEVSGKNFARIVYLPDMMWTVSLISNLAKGRSQIQSEDGFVKTHALKIDYTGEAAYSGVIISHDERGESNAGAFCGWTVSNAMLIYGDLNFSTDEKTALLSGLSYTLESGPTFALEYAYQEHNPASINHHTVMLQYHQNEIINRIDLLFRATANIDDKSMQFVTNADYIAGDHIQLFLNTIVNFNSDTGEFGRFLDYQVMAGLEYSF
jgi:hypothetical protein